jgi:hypothetical protein
VTSDPLVLPKVLHLVDPKLEEEGVLQALPFWPLALLALMPPQGNPADAQQLLLQTLVAANRPSLLLLALRMLLQTLALCLASQL